METFSLWRNISSAEITIWIFLFLSGTSSIHMLKEEPSVTLYSDRLLHLHYHKSFITCKGEGVPSPTIEWDWRPCDKLNCQSEYKPVRREEKDINIREKIQANDPGIKESKIEFRSLQSGYFRCKAVNKYGEKTAEILIIASEYKDGFEIKALHDDEVMETTTFSLTCGATVFNYSSLYWKWKPNTATSEDDYISLEGREGFEFINESNGDTLRVTVKMERIDINKSGEYVCFGKRINTDKEDNRSRIVEVEAIVPTEFTSETNLNGSIIQIDIDKEFSLNCVARGKPAPYITWWKDDQRLNIATFDQWIFEEDGTVLSIGRLNVKDAGLYVCQAENLGRNGNANLTIEKTEEPSVTLYSDRRLHFRDHMSVITCKGRGIPSPSIEWDWRPCDKPNCQAKYKPVRPVRSVRRVRSLLPVRSERPECQEWLKWPEYEEWLEQQEFQEWLKLQKWPVKPEEKDIKITEKIQPNDPGIKESKIEFRPRQSGYFRCKAVNKYGEKTAEILIIASEYKDGFAIKALHDDEVMETTTFTLTCGATVFNYSSLYWKWKPNTATSEDDYVSLEGREGFEIISESNGDTLRVTVKMERIDINMSGEYVCFGKRINTDKEDNRSRIVEVEAIVPPEFTSETNLNGSIIHKKFYQEFSLKCVARGKPAPNITWWKNGQRLNDPNKQLLLFNEKRTVWYGRLFVKDAGLYVCQAENLGGNASANLTIEVTGIIPPEFTSKTNLKGSIIHVESQKEFTLICEARGKPRPEITWWKDGHQLEATEKRFRLKEKRTVLIIKRLRIEDTGCYVCQAENLGGNASANLTIEVTNVRTIFVERDQENEISWTIYLIIPMVVISLILFILLGFFVKKIKKERVHRREVEIISQMLFKHGDPKRYNPDLPLDGQVELLPYDKRWEFPKERLKLGKTLGQGAFGRVVKAEAIGLQDGEAATTVAVKMLKQRADLNQKKALMQELKVMIHLGRHLNVVNLLGAVTKNIKKGEFLVVVEFCRYGNLRHFLLRHRDHFINQIDSRTRKINHQINEFNDLDENSASELKAIEAAANTIHGQNRPLHYADLTFSSYRNSISSGNDSDLTVPPDMRMLKMSTIAPKSSFDSSSGAEAPDYLTTYKENTDRKLTTRDLLCYSFQVARGMEYLSSRKLVHRDLAARNILLADDNVVKICDFGLAKDLYKYSNYKRKGNGPLPIKWMALESIRDKVFSSQSDIWSFGIVLWEFFTLGGNPYPGIEIDEEFYKKLKSGYRMDQPEFSTAEVYKIMQSCWLAEAKDRPTFMELVNQLGSQLEASVRKYYVDLNNPYMTMNDTFRNNNDYLTMDTGDDRNYINKNHVISPPLSPDYMNAPSRPHNESINSDYLNKQSPILTNFNHTNSPFCDSSNVEEVHAASDKTLELKPLALPDLLKIRGSLKT